MMLLDDIKDLPPSAWKTPISPYHAKEMKTAARRARSYVFDVAASEKLGHFIRLCPDVICDQVEFAIPPYETTYIEIDLLAAHAAMNAPLQEMMGEPDWHLGMLATPTGAVYSFTDARSRPYHTVANLFGAIDLQNATRSEMKTLNAADMEEGKLAPMTPDDLRDPQPGDSAVALGSTWNHVNEDQRKHFAQRWGLAYYGVPSLFPTFRRLISSHVGEPRMFVAALLMLHQKRHITINDHPYERRMSRGKSRVFMAHHTITIHLESDAEIRRAFTTGERGSPRRHQVPAHFAHRGGTRACEHHWIQREDAKTGEPVTRWGCPYCGRFRWLRREHLRGDATKGWSGHDYDVKL